MQPTNPFFVNFASSIIAVLGCHDRLIFKGHLPFSDEVRLNRFVDHTLRIKRKDDVLDVRATLGKMPPALLGNPQERMGSLLSNRRGGFPLILQHDTVLKPGDCGGPLVDLDGKAVGLNIARAGRVETYAVPSESVQALLPDLMSGKLAPKDDVLEKKQN